MRRRLVTLLLCIAWLFSPAFADTPKRYASIVVDADTLEIIHARQVDGQRYPASLTKVMTLYLTFDALNSGQLKMNETLTTSRNAASTPPYGLGLRRGEKITVEQAIQALIVRSANDVAVVLAERIAGSEAAFASQMTAKARALNMQRSTFMTPHGLPHPDQTTTARDMAKLATAMLTQHRRYYYYFGQRTFKWKGRNARNTNSLLHWLEGVDGFKTGYTNASGYNLIISAERDGRRIVAVVLGGATGKSRDQHMRDLIERSFKVIGVKPAPNRAPVMISHEPQTMPVTPQLASVTQAVRLRSHGQERLAIIQGNTGLKIAERNYDRSWSVQVGAYDSPSAALTQLETLAGNTLDITKSTIAPTTRNKRTLYRARFTNLTSTQAQEACKVLNNSPSGCHVIAPGNG